MVFMMFRRGGCCGNGQSSHNDFDKERHRGGCCGGEHTNHLKHEDKEKNS